MDYLQTLMNLLNAEEEVDERIFPWPNEYYILYHLKEKFPEHSISLNQLRTLLNEELALKTITLRDQGLKSASSSNF